MECKYNHEDWCGVKYPRQIPNCPCDEYEEGKEEFLHFTSCKSVKINWVDKILNKIRRNLNVENE
jgi:hypothetical protein